MSQMCDFFTVDLNGEKKKISRFCPHRAGRLDHGHINERSRTITCPLHCSVFSLENGAQLAGPECGSINVITTTHTV